MRKLDRIHPTPSAYLSRAVSVLLIGCGGNGSLMLTGLGRLNHALTALGHPGLDVTAYDDDTVSEANMGRQMFSPADVGLHKSSVLVHRVNQFFGLNWRAEPHRFASDQDANTYSLNGKPTIAIVCVDSATARASIYSFLESRSFRGYILDLGNRASDGQVLLGQLSASGDLPPLLADDGIEPAARLPAPHRVLPELVDTTAPPDDEPSCGLAAALERQELFVNQAVATPALALLWEFFRYGKLTWCGAFVNLKTGNMRPIAVPAGE
ncbi:dinucleotide-utilizing protein [Pandoraea pnomenusa]|uniref:PRTRC system ThiF family protein n=1 Tax=Pandoraea pnomenusa TaxID=93220 RepID=A0A378YVF4_9BURK|nr:PRTRC system ThiF family protein [Pandoraea pnomenusa]AIU28358.1 dinucleotide-utilizing protein [Pandoraea pnomenusa]SUA80409.1 PRTRC system ThiF family protein [Pandoraea pnomenusa]